MIGSILLVLLLVALVGFIVHLITTHIPMHDAFKQLIVVICIVLICLYLIGLVMGTITLPSIARIV